MSVQDKDATDVTIDEIRSLIKNPLEYTLFSEKSTLGESEFVNTAKYKGITFIVEAESVTSGADLEFQGSIDGINGFDITTFEGNGDVGLITQSISSNGVSVYTVPDSITVKYMAVKFATRTDGTYTVTILGKPL